MIGISNELIMMWNGAGQGKVVDCIDIIVLCFSIRLLITLILERYIVTVVCFCSNGKVHFIMRLFVKNVAISNAWVGLVWFWISDMPLKAWSALFCFGLILVNALCFWNFGAGYLHLLSWFLIALVFYWFKFVVDIIDWQCWW